MSADKPKYALEVMQDVLTALEWDDALTYDLEECRCVYDTGIMINDQKFELFCSIDDGVDLATVYLYAPLRVPAERLPDTLALVNHINTRLLLGLVNVFEDGQLQFRCRIDVEGGTLGPTMVMTMIDAAIKTFRDWFERLALVALGGADVEEVIAAAREEEQRTEDRRRARLH